MTAFFKKTFRDFRWSIITYSLIVVVYGAFLVSFFPAVKKLSMDFDKLLESVPKAFTSAFGMSGNSFTTLQGYLSVEYFSLTWILIVGVLIFSLGAAVVAGELDKGTGEFSFTLPIRRYKVVLGKFLASAAITLTVIVLSFLSIIIACSVAGESLSLAGFFHLFLLASSMFFFLLCFATFFSTVLRTKGSVYAVSGGYFAFSYLTHVLHGISDQIGFIYNLSFMKYYGVPQSILAGAGIPTGNILVFLIAGAVLLLASFVVVEKRDL